jgi:hypothetical protein
MNTLLHSILESAGEFFQQNRRRATIITFSSPKRNEILLFSRHDILNAGIATKEEIAAFIRKVGIDGLDAFIGRKVYGLKIRIFLNPSAKDFTVE